MNGGQCTDEGQFFLSKADRCDREVKFRRHGQIDADSATGKYRTDNPWAMMGNVEVASTIPEAYGIWSAG